jgi:glycosyltransferase involved in cell wall biosynthesis
MNKIKVLITNLDSHGVNFYRSEQPAIMLAKTHPDDFEIDYIKDVNWDDFNFLGQYDIIHSHRTFCHEYEKMPELVSKLHEMGIVTILDIDDYWEVSIEHPLHAAIKKDNLKEKIINNLKLVNYITTTTPIFAEYIREYNQNVFVIENGVNTELKEFKEIEKEKCDKLRLLYLAGSSHLQDVSLLKDSFDVLNSDSDLKNKYQINLAGFDLRGTTTTLTVNDDFLKELQAMGLFTQEMYKLLHNVNFDLKKIPNLPKTLLDKYPNGIIIEEVKPIKPEDTVWTLYEKIFTSNYKLIYDSNYLDFLKKYDLDKQYENIKEQNYIRHKTQGLYKFASNYRHGDIALAPIKVYGKGVTDDNFNNRYQFAKSNLKVIEAAFHKVPVIASNVPIYNFDKDWIDGYNIIFVDANRQYKDWYKKIKYCIKNPDYVKELGENAYQTALKKYELKVLTQKRADIYKQIIQEKTK